MEGIVTWGRKVAGAGSRMLGRHRALWGLCFLLAVLSVMDVPFSPLFGLNLGLIVLYLLTVGAFKASVLTLVFGAMVESNRLLRITAYVLIVCFTILCLVNAGGFLFYGFGISRKLIVIFSQTNGTEVNEFLPGLGANISALLSTWQAWTVIALATLLTVGIAWLPKKIFVGSTVALSIAGIAYIIVLGCIIPKGRTAHFLALRIPRYSYDVYKSNLEFQQILAKRKAFPHPEEVHSDRKATNLIFVIGESASRGHHSLYGYPLNTTPNLLAMRDSLYVFTDAIGSSVSTAGNIERILTFKEDDTTFDDWYEYPLLTDLFSNAGYRTYYLSNQERTGLFSNSSGAIAETADVVNYVGADNSEDALVQKYDEAVLRPLKSYLSEPVADKLIIVHLMGSHTQYKNRYPEEYSRFTTEDIRKISKGRPWLDDRKARIVAEYDNSILYTDSILAEIIRYASALKEPTLVVYISDHGEEVYDRRNFLGRDEKFVEVPLIVYANKAYRKFNEELMRQLGDAVGLPVSTANMIYPLMTLTGTQYPPAYNASKDFLNPAFSASHRMVDEKPWPQE